MKRRCDICGKLRSVQALLVRRTYLGVKLTNPFYVCRRAHCLKRSRP